MDVKVRTGGNEMVTAYICNKAGMSVGHLLLGAQIEAMNEMELAQAADAGISVDSAVDIAKESSDIILLEISLMVLELGALEGRRVCCCAMQF